MPSLTDRNIPDNTSCGGAGQKAILLEAPQQHQDDKDPPLSFPDHVQDAATNGTINTNLIVAQEERTMLAEDTSSNSAWCAPGVAAYQHHHGTGGAPPSSRSSYDFQHQHLKILSDALPTFTTRLTQANHFVVAPTPRPRPAGDDNRGLLMASSGGTSSNLNEDDSTTSSRIILSPTSSSTMSTSSSATTLTLSSSSSTAMNMVPDRSAGVPYPSQHQIQAINPHLLPRRPIARRSSNVSGGPTNDILVGRIGTTTSGSKVLLHPPSMHKQQKGSMLGPSTITPQHSLHPTSTSSLEILAAAAKNASFLKENHVHDDGDQKKQHLLGIKAGTTMQNHHLLSRSKENKSSMGQNSVESSIRAFPYRYQQEHQSQIQSAVQEGVYYQHQGGESHHFVIQSPPRADVSSSVVLKEAANQSSVLLREAANQHFANMNFSSSLCSDLNSSRANFTRHDTNNLFSYNAPAAAQYFSGAVGDLFVHNTPKASIPIVNERVPYFSVSVPNHGGYHCASQQQMQGQQVMNSNEKGIHTVDEGQLKSNTQEPTKKPTVISSAISKGEIQMGNNTQTNHDTMPSNEKPRRPLNAYNFFFREEREAIIAEVGYFLSVEKQKGGGDVSPSEKEVAKILQSPQLLLPAAIQIELKMKMKLKSQQLLEARKETEKEKKGPHRRIHGIGFRQLSKAIAKRWKTCEPERKAYYKNLAKMDTDLYTRDMNDYAKKVLDLVNNNKP